MIIASPAAQEFVKGLNAKFPEDTFTAMPGKRYDRIVRQAKNSTQRMAYAFIECETGHVFKSAGWAAPAKGVRYTSVTAAIAAADPYGSFLYKR